MTDAFDRVLRLVANGRLTAAEAEPILEALDTSPAPGTAPRPTGEGPGSEHRIARIEVTEGGRRIVNLRVPLSLGWSALSAIPGLSPDHAAELRTAVASGARGPIVDVTDEHGDGARIVLE